jgi:hypothetical protein
VAGTYTIPDASQIITFRPDLSDRRLLGHAGHVTGLVYSFTLPGGPDQLQATLECPVTQRTPAIDPGRIVQVIRGGAVVWTGKMNEPVPAPGGWGISAEGSGDFASDMLAVYTSTWPTSQPDQSINNAITRGLNWVNPGVGTPATAWYGQEVDSGAQAISDLLNLICTRGGLTWQVNPQPGGQNILSVYPLPAMVNRLLVCTTPVARTLSGNYNTIFVRYQVSADNATSGAAAVYATTSVTNTVDVAAHEPMEAYIDLSNAGTMTGAAARAVGNYCLQVYQRATFAGPFTAAPGQLLTTGGQPVDLGTDQAGTVMQLIITDLGYGGEVTEAVPVTFITGNYAYDDQAQLATITPFQSLDQSLTGLLSMESTVLTPITPA